MNERSTTRRSFLAALGAAVPVLAAAPAKAWALSSSQPPFTSTKAGLWEALEHVTDGTDPSTSVIAPPRFTQDIRNLVGSRIKLTGYVQPLSGGFGPQKNYLLSRNIFHCPYCYAFGRGSLASVTLKNHLPMPFDKKVTLEGRFALQDRDPSDFYFELTNADLVS